MNYEDLIRETEEEGIEIFENNYIGKLKGLYVDNTITINSNIKTNKEKACILAEELGHYHTSFGDIRDQSETKNRKQELRARIWAYNKKIGLTGIIKAYENRCRNKAEMAEYLDVTEDFLKDALSYYQSKYGLYTEVGSYCIYFNPLTVCKYNFQ